MKGTRPLDNNEIRLVSAYFSGKFEVRNRALFLLGVSTGGRISELLSLRIGDVYQNEKPVTDLLFDKSIVKGGEVSRAVPVNVDGRRAIDDLVSWHREAYQNTEPDRPLFPSRQKSGRVAMHRQTAHDILKTAFTAAGLNGKLATHSLLKSFAQRVYEQSGDTARIIGVSIYVDKEQYHMDKYKSYNSLFYTTGFWTFEERVIRRVCSSKYWNHKTITRF